MELARTEKLLWAYGFLQNLTLLIVLIWRGRTRSFRAFTALIAFGTLRTLVLFSIFRHTGRHHAYALAYWWTAAIDLLLQVGVVYEIAKSALFRSEEWLPKAKMKFLLLASAAPLIGLVLASAMTPAAHSQMDAWDARANLFSTVTICVMVSAVMTVSRQLGAGWSRLLLRFSAGLAVWSIASFVTETLHAYWKMIDQFSSIENFVGGMYLLVTLYWIVIFWCSKSEQFPSGRRNEEWRARLFLLAERLRR